MARIDVQGAKEAAKGTAIGFGIFMAVILIITYLHIYVGHGW